MKQLPANRYVTFLLIVVFFLVADLESKRIIFTDLGYTDDEGTTIQAGTHQLFDAPGFTDGQSVPYIDGAAGISFRLFTTFNKGALWGMGQNLTHVFAALGVIAGLALCYWLFIHGAAISKWLNVALAFVMAGTLGNLYDRMGWHGCKTIEGEIIYGVRDFMYFNFWGFNWAIWNLADACLVTGAIMLIVQSFIHEEASDPSVTDDDDAGNAADAEPAASSTDDADHSDPADESQIQSAALVEPNGC